MKNLIIKLEIILAVLTQMNMWACKDGNTNIDLAALA